MATSSRVRIGLIGCGRMGATLIHHLAYTVEQADLVAVADANREKGAEVAARYQVAQVYDDYEALLARDDLAAVVIATPTGTHVEVIKAAAAAGKQIFTEKPLAMTLAGCDEAIATARQAGVLLQVGFMRRFDPSYLAAKQQIEQGVIGQPVLFKSLSRDPYRTSLEFARRENGGGMILDMGVHDFDLGRWLMGSEVVRVYSEGTCMAFPELKEVGDIDNALVNLRFANGAVGNVDLSRNAVYGYDIQTEVLGTEGSLRIGRLQHTSAVLLDRRGVTHDTLPYFVERFADAYAAEIRHFVAAVADGRPPAVSGEDARAATAIGVAATRSLDEERPVYLTEIG
jgi:inositol 2-dehydrogenase